MASFPRLQQLLRLKPEKRPTAAAIARHPWLVRSLDVLRRICVFSPIDGFFYRISIQLAKSHDSTSVLQCVWDLGDSRSWGSCRSSDFHDSEAQNMDYFFPNRFFCPLKVQWSDGYHGSNISEEAVSFGYELSFEFYVLFRTFLQTLISMEASQSFELRQLQDNWRTPVFSICKTQLRDRVSICNVQDAECHPFHCLFRAMEASGKRPHRRHRFFRFFFDSVRWPGQAQCRGPLTEQVGLDKTARASH